MGEYTNRNPKLSYTRKPIDWEQVGMCASMLATGEEIAAFTGVNINTIKDRCYEENGIHWEEFLERHRAIGKMSIRRAQMKLAIDQGNVSMLIHLGKSELGQDSTSKKQPDNEDDTRLSKIYKYLEERNVESLINDPVLIRKRYLASKNIIDNEDSNDK